MDPARLLRFRGPRVRAGNAALLRAGTALGQRGADRALSVVDALLAVLLAPTCLACDEAIAAPLAGPICPACWRAVVPLPGRLCPTCGDPLPAAAPCIRCLTRRPCLARSQAAGAYEGTLRTAIHALKYDGRRSLARPLGRLMRAHAGAMLDGADALVPVPLHRSRHRARGFNQAADLAKHLGLPVSHLLTRIRSTRPQADLAEDQREGNVLDAFAPARRMHDARGRVLVLVDDVSTTGATLEACARVLLAAGATQVRAITAARAVRGRPL